MTVLPEKISIDDAIHAVEVWMQLEKIDLGLQWEFTVKLTKTNPWLIINVKPSVPYVIGEAPDHLEFVVWAETGALHRVILGEVQDPPIGLIIPKVAT
jgi:hypothetical protein